MPPADTSATRPAASRSPAPNDPEQVIKKPLKKPARVTGPAAKTAGGSAAPVKAAANKPVKARAMLAMGKADKPAKPARAPGLAQPKPPAVTAPARAAMPVTPPAKDAKPADPATKPARSKERPVRDSFTMPREDYVLIAQIKDRALGFKRPTKKSELLRAGLQALAALTDAKLQAALDSLRPLPTGRPKKGH